MVSNIYPAVHQTGIFYVATFPAVAQQSRQIKAPLARETQGKYADKIIVSPNAVVAYLCRIGREPPGGFEFAASSSTLVIQNERPGRPGLDFVEAFDEGGLRTFYRGEIAGASRPFQAGKGDELVVSSSSLIVSSKWIL
ncbi:hypothetical protein VCV18_003256 [Metarhizium anisopliae]